MAQRFKVILILFIFCNLKSISQNISDNDLLRKTVGIYGQARIVIPFPGNRQLIDLSRNLSVNSVKDKNLEIILSPLTVEWFIAQNIKYEFARKSASGNILTSSDIKQAMEWESYPTYQQYDSIMQSFAASYPSLCDIDTIGTSIYGKLVLVLKISDNVGEDEDEPSTFYTSSMHGDEIAGFVLMLRFADYLLENYNKNDRIKNLVDNLEVWINPLANPDGTYGTGNEISSPVRFNANGYDLNRNFPDPAISNTIVQKETSDMVKFMREHRFKLSANFHSGAEVVNYPWDSRWWRHADDDWFYSISRGYADTVHLYSPLNYMTDFDNGITNGFEWYSINGGRQDFVTYELQGREVTIELHDEYLTPASQLSLLWEYNYRSLLGYLENALYGIRGYVKEKDTGNPVSAKIFITDHDIDSSHVYSDSLTGSFIRMLAPGKWDLKFSASGYFNKIIHDIIVGQGEAISIDVEMVPFINHVDSTDTPGLFIYPNPSRDHFTLVLPERQYGTVSIVIFNSMGSKITDYTGEVVDDTPLEIDVTGMEEGVYILQVRNKSSKITDRIRFVVISR